MANSEHEDVAAYLTHGRSLVGAVETAIKPWLRRRVAELTGSASFDVPVGEGIDAAATRAVAAVRRLIEADVDQPLSGPLEQIRVAVAPLNDILAAAGVRPPGRDPFEVNARPDDVYALGPMAFSDLGEEVQKAGITWGAAKAFLHNQRRSGAVE